MRLTDISILCLKNLKREKGKAALAILGILVGCFSLMLSVSLQRGETRISDPFAQGGLIIIGVISLCGAVAGIRGTLAVSAKERKKEIGLMKVFGCFDRDIYILFMMEAGLIGLLGGLGGCVASCLVAAADRSVMGTVPFWLYFMGLLFSVLTGLFSGRYPAKKAVTISALEGIQSRQI